MSKFLLPLCRPLMRDVQQLPEAYELPDLVRTEVVHICVAEKFWLLSPETSDDEGRLRRLIKRSLVLCAFSPWWSQKGHGLPKSGLEKPRLAGARYTYLNRLHCCLFFPLSPSLATNYIRSLFSTVLFESLRWRILWITP